MRVEGMRVLGHPSGMYHLGCRDRLFLGKPEHLTQNFVIRIWGLGTTVEVL